MKLNISRFVVVGIGIISVVALYGIVQYGYFVRNESETFSNMEEFGGPASWPTNFNDNRLFMGFYQNVFAAKITEEIGKVVSNPGLGLLNVQYSAEAIYNIKGEVEGRLVIDLDATKGAHLVIGTTYIFGAIHQDGPGPYYVSFHPAMATVVTRDANLTREQLGELVLRHSRTYELLNAYPNEILNEAHIEHGNIGNAFTTLTEEKKQAVFAQFDELIPPRPVPEILPPVSATSTPWQNIERGTRCFDAIDNDGDGLVDREEAECNTYYREDLPSFCKDEEDNDLDGLTDAQDPDCAPFYAPPAPPYVPPPPPPSTTSTGQ